MYASVEGKEGVSDKVEINTPGTVRVFNVPTSSTMLYQFTARTSIYQASILGGHNASLNPLESSIQTKIVTVRPSQIIMNKSKYILTVC